MKLLVITAFYPPHHVGGYEMRCKEVLDGLIKRGHEILVISDHCTEQPCKLHSNEKGIQRVLHKKSEASSVFQQIFHDCLDLRFIHRKVREFKPEIVYLWALQNLSNTIFPYFSTQKVQVVYDEGGSGLIFLAKIYRHGIYFYQNDNDPIVKKWSKHIIYAFASLISSNLIKPKWTWPENMRLYFNSKSALRHSQKHGVPVDCASVIHSGIRLDEFPYLARQRLHSPLVILVPGRIKPEKGTKDALSLVKELIRRNISARLRLVGNIQSEEYFDDMLGAIDENGLNGVVEYIPMVSQANLARFYQEADICFFPTYFKTGFSRVPLESMASGCLVITYGNEGSAEVIQDGQTGFVISESDVFAAADRIECMIKAPNQYRDIIQQAREKVATEHSMDTYIGAIESYLVESVANPNFATISR